VRARSLGVLGLALALRLAAAFWSDGEVADVLRYRKVADHVLDVSWNPYQAPRLYPYPPLWVWVEAGCGWLSRHAGLPFPIVVKLPVVAADLAIVGLFLAAGRLRAAWVYACHPVSLLVTGFHGQFEALALLFVLLALSWFERGRDDASALALAVAIGLKALPVLLLPLFLLAMSDWRRRCRYAALATLPVAVLLLPFAVHDLPALRRELFGYGGVADFGWIGLLRGIAWLRTGALGKGRGEAWGILIPLGKVVFLAGYAAILAALARRRLRWDLTQACLAVFLAFLVLYGALSAQYLLWVVPLAALTDDRFSWPYAVAATLALIGFYAFLAPGVLYPADRGWLPPSRAGALWVAGVGATWAITLSWLAAHVRRGLRRAG
jgi:hypothetical protein